MTEWRSVPIKGYAEYYSVSNDGQIRREKRGPGTRIGFILKPRSDKDGYATVILWKDNQPKTCKVHRLVLGAFIGPCKPGFNSNHKDGIKTNNHVSNLEYTTVAQNNLHAWRNLPRKRRTPVTRCRRGHFFTAENTIQEIHTEGYQSKRCRICRKASKRR